MDQRGYTLLELMLALAVGSLVLAGSYASFTVINTQYIKIVQTGSSDGNFWSIHELKIN